MGLFKKMKKVLLIEPGTTVTHPPIGILHLASAIRDKYNVKIKDYSGEDINLDQVENMIRIYDPFVVGLRVLTGPCIPRALAISKIAKKLGIPVMWGGPHPTILPKQTLKNEYIDAVCIGEGEYTILDLLSYFEGNKEEVLGAGIKKNGEIKIFPNQEKVVDFKELPMPSWDLLEDIDRYFPEKDHNELLVSTTRGCVFKCGFCHNSNDNVKCYLGKYRIAEPERAIEELRYVQKLVKGKIDILNVGEDLHLISYDYTKKFCDAIANSGIKDLKWTTSTRYSILNEKIVNLMAEHNCKSVLLGVESGSKRIQDLNGKGVNLQKAIEMARLMKKKGIFVTNAYIFGHPTETSEELKQTLNHIKKIPADENLIQLYRPMPGTPYFELCVKEGNLKKVPKKLEEWSYFGVLGHDVNVSKVPTKELNYAFYKTNAIEQTKFLFNQQRFFIHEKMYSKFIKSFIQNRFTHKLKEFLKK
jgi:anaerobic magnesium-protoporphyrin IX monomethyl ester cyclase